MHASVVENARLLDLERLLTWVIVPKRVKNANAVYHLSAMKELTEEERRVMLQGGTEAPFTGKYVDTHDPGVYRCKQCGTILFTAETKFDSGTGWPSFSDPAVAANVGTRKDTSHGMQRTEVFCKKCGAHLGHVFDDGPREKGGKRYCINSVCLEFEREDTEAS
jgi:peptide-methionine (R)-S-oxide reductase